MGAQAGRDTRMRGDTEMRSERYFVSTQHQWPDGFKYVEVTSGGVDSMGCDVEELNYC